MAKFQNPNDDLFHEKSTMSFGDHLEELRAALFRSVVGLLVGFAIGLAVADQVVKAIKAPLAASLEDFFVQRSLDQIKAEHPDDPDLITPELIEFVRERRLVFDRIYLEAGEIERLGSLVPAADAGNDSSDKAPTATAETTASQGAEITLTKAATEPVTTPDKRTPNQEVQVLGEPLPPPGNVLLATRIWRPVQHVVKALSAHEVFMIWVKAALVAGAVIASPYIFYQIWNFVAAGLYSHEKKHVYMYLPISLSLFLFGAFLAFKWVIPSVLTWLFQFNRTLNIDPDPRISEWIGFALFLPLGFGISFQLPLVMVLLNRIGLFSIDVYLAKWRIAILVIFVLSMILTPADPVSMLMMAVPLTVLYFGGIALCKYMPRGRNPFDEAYEP
jgi:sec-independent protein translocase protein TatC